MSVPKDLEDRLAAQQEEFEEVEEEETEEVEEAPEESVEEEVEESEEPSEEEAEEPEQAEEDWKAKYEEAERAKAGILSNLTSLRKEGSDLKRIVSQMQQDFQALQPMPQDDLPEFESDPVSHLNSKVDYILERMEQQNLTTQQTEALKEYQRRVETVAAKTREYEEEWRKEHPDYDAAYNRLQTMFYNSYLAGGMDEAQAQGQVANLALRFAVDALQQGKNPAEEAYKVALSYGHQPAEQPKKAPARTQIPEKVKKGTKAPSSASMAKSGSKATRAPGAEVSHEDFWNNWTAAERAPYVANPEFFEAIMTQKRAVLPF